ncbi:MAG: phosphoglycerate kinase [Chloroflexi bacterium]|nr:phosphoglycerate kinase [Chloroflexota bacterium]MBA3739861.1 phosphoglycerate kinase [Chloroflexota bacterium]
MDAKTIRDVDVSGKRVFLRADLNVPLDDGRITDDTRIRASLPTIVNLLERGATVVLASHLGRPKGKVNDALRLRPVADRLSQLLGRQVRMTGDALGPGVKVALDKLRPGDLLLLENLRFHAAEEANDPDFAASLAGLADLYVNDAFGAAHRAHASTEGITHHLPAVAGLLMEREVDALSRLLKRPARPFHAVIGGAKVSGKLEVLTALLSRCQAVLVGGGMANTFLAAKGHELGTSLVEEDQIGNARRMLSEARRKRVRLMLPSDAVVAPQIHQRASTRTVSISSVPKDQMVVDIGPETLAAYTEHLARARTIFWNGPMGVFEMPQMAGGTNGMARFLAKRFRAGVVTVVGGGDSVAALEQLGLAARMTHVSTGGGASLEFLEGKSLPGVTALLRADAAIDVTGEKA